MFTFLQYQLLITCIFLGLGAGIRCPGCEKPFEIQWWSCGKEQRRPGNVECSYPVIQQCLVQCYGFFYFKKICVEMMVQETFPDHVLSLIWERIAVSELLARPKHLIL